MWDYYKIYFSSSGTGQLKTPTKSWQWNQSAGGDDKWELRPKADAPITTSDADGSIYIQYDTSTTENGHNNSEDSDLLIAGAAVEMGSTGVTGGKFDSSSSGDYFDTKETIVDNMIGSYSVSNPPPQIKLRYQNQGASSGHLLAFVSFRKNPNQ